MKLVHNWKELLLKAWSVRVALAIAGLEGLSYVWPYFNEVVSLPVLTAVQLLLSVGVVIARLLDQGIDDVQLHKE